MRPDRSIVKKAIVDAGGNLSRASALLGCTRQTLYTWCYQLGLERFAGIRMDKRRELDARERVDDPSQKPFKSPVYSAPTPPSNLRRVETMDLPVQTSMKLPESLWKRVKIEAIREGCTVSEFVRKTLEATLAGPVAVPRRKKAEKNGESSE